MLTSGSDPLDFILTVIVGLALIIVLGGGAYKTWRSWSDDHKIRKHLRQ
jgi:hypothetical protein